MTKNEFAQFFLRDGVVVIDTSVYMSVAARNECICLYRYC